MVIFCENVQGEVNIADIDIGPYRKIWKRIKKVTQNSSSISPNVFI